MPPVSCGEESDDALLTGVFTKTGVDLGEGFWTNGTLAFSDGKLCVVGELRDDNSPAMAVVNTADMTVSVRKAADFRLRVGYRGRERRRSLRREQF